MQLETYLGSFPRIFILSDGGSPRLVKKMEVELAMKPLHPTSIGNTFLIQPFLRHCSRRSSYFSNLYWCAQLKFSSKGTVNSITKTFFALTYQMTISGCFVLTLFQLERWSYVLNRLRCASLCSPQAMMVYACFYVQFSKYFLL